MQPSRRQSSASCLAKENELPGIASWVVNLDFSDRCAALFSSLGAKPSNSVNQLISADEAKVASRESHRSQQGPSLASGVKFFSVGQPQVTVEAAKGENAAVENHCGQTAARPHHARSKGPHVLDGVELFNAGEHQLTVEASKSENHS